MPVRHYRILNMVFQIVEASTGRSLADVVADQQFLPAKFIAIDGGEFCRQCKIKSPTGNSKHPDGDQTQGDRQLRANRSRAKPGGADLNHCLSSRT